MSSDLAEPLDRLLADRCPPAQLRRHLAGEPLDVLWGEISALGYGDALVEAEFGGAGLPLAELTSVALILGRRLCPLPLAETMVARALLTRWGVEVPKGPILLLTPVRQADGSLFVPAAPLAKASSHALLDLGGECRLAALSDANRSGVAPGLSLAADLRWDSAPTLMPEAAPVSLREISAVFRAAAIAGLATGALDLVVDHAATRRQFGKSIGEFQAIQQQIAMLAEEVAAASAAAALGLSGTSRWPQPMNAAIAKMRSSLAAAQVAAIAHAVHGAIGISEEYDLQLFTRRLAEERMADGGVDYWAERIGSARLAHRDEDSLSFVRGLMA